MENIFNFATKELNQDAFLCWLISNFEDETIGKYSYDFINEFAHFDFKVGEIKIITIKQQESDIDIVVDLWTSKAKCPESHYVIIIEDKTASSAHTSQLKRYADIVDKWNNNEDGFKNRRRKIFYKTNFLTDKDIEELSLANEDRADNDDKWLDYDIKAINAFFSKIPPTSSEILNFYIEHIKKTYEDLMIVSSDPINEWNLINFQTLCKDLYNEHKNEIGGHFETWQYQGRLVSSAFYYHLTNEKYNKNNPGEYPNFAYPLVEFVFRKHSKKIDVYTHVTFHWGENNWKWKHTKYEPDPEESKNFISEVKEKLGDSGLKVKILKMGSERAQTISSESITTPDNIQDMKKIIIDKVKAYFEVFKQLDD